MLSHQLPKLWLYSWSRSKQNQLLTQLIPLLVWLGIRLVRVTASSFSRKLEVHSDQRQESATSMDVTSHRCSPPSPRAGSGPPLEEDSWSLLRLVPALHLGTNCSPGQKGIQVTKTFLMQRASGSTNEKARPSIKDNLITHELRKEVECFRILSML